MTAHCNCSQLHCQEEWTVFFEICGVFHVCWQWEKKNQIKTISWRFLSLEEIRTKTNVCEPNIQWLLTWRHYSEVESGRNFFRCIELWASKWESVNSCACWVMHPPPGRTVRIATAEFWFPVLVWDYILGFMLPLLIWWDKGKLSNWC